MLRSRRSRSRRAQLAAGARGARGDAGSDGSAARALLLVAIAVGLLAIGFGIGRWSADRRALEPVATTDPAAPTGAPTLPAPLAAAAAPASIEAPAAAPAPEEPEPAIPPGNGAAVAIVIDDLGRSVETIDQLRAFGVSLTYAVLPFEPRTAEVAARLVELGEEILVHLPMEAQQGENPGPGALTESMDEATLRDSTRIALEAVPGAAGVNNHMGSALSEDRAAMSAILDEVQGRGLYFLDSRTSAASVGFALARELGVRAAERKVFLDRDRAPRAIRHEFRRLLAVARRGEPAIAIGHPYPETLAVLAEEIAPAQANGYRFVRVSDLLARSSD